MAARKLARSYRHVQRLQHRIGGLPALHRPTHHAAGIENDHDGQIGKALQGSDVGDVCHPSPVGRGHVELATQSVVDRQGRLAAIAPRSAPVTDLRLDTRQPGQSGNAVQAAGLTLIQQVVVQLAVAIDLTTVVPGLPDQLCLPSIFLGPRAQWALLPSIETVGLDAQAPTHRLNPELVTMLGNKRVSHFASLAKRSDRRSNTRWLFRLSRSSVIRARSHFNCRVSASLEDTMLIRVEGHRLAVLIDILARRLHIGAGALALDHLKVH